MIHLFENYPKLKENLPYIPLGNFPTPVHHLKRLGKEIGTAMLYLKDDGVSGTRYGGNKVRKLEFLLGDALRKGVKEVLTFGYAGSNHALATAVYAQQVGIKSNSVLLAQPIARYVRRNLLFTHVCGADIHHTEKEMGAYIRAILIFIQKRLKGGKFPSVIMPGGSSPLGTMGYVNAGLELKDQVENGLLPEPAKVFLPLGTMGTAVGLAIGIKAAGMKTHLLPVRVVDEKLGNEEKFFRLFQDTVRLIRSHDPSFPEVDITQEEVEIIHDFYGGQYARFTDAGMEAVDQILRTEGMKLEGTYTGKAMAALIAHVQEKGQKDEGILFWNTHNDRNFDSMIEGVDYHQLPKSVHRYFEGEVQPLDVLH